LPRNDCGGVKSSAGLRANRLTDPVCKLGQALCRINAVASSSAVIRSSLLAHFKRLALSLDLNPVALAKRAGIDRRYLDDPDLTLPLRAMVELFEIAALTSGLEDFGLRLAEVRGLPDLGPVILMLREEPNLREALRTLAALVHLHSDAIYMHLEEGDDPVFTVDFIGSGIGHCRQAMDTSIASNLLILRWLLGENWAPAAVCFAHSPPISRARYDNFFRCPISFLHDFNGIILRSRDLDKKLPASSPVLRRQVERYIRTIDVAPSDTYVHRVTQVIAMSLPKGEAKASMIARCLGTDCRTLNRRLARADLNYSAVLQTVRKNVASQHMLSSDRPLSDIAGLVGFAGLSTFDRWFRQAFGCAPSTWRRMQRRKQKR
jgi:AraC-like DNA-binding protein